METLFSIDPGNTESAYVVLSDSLRPLRIDKTDNSSVMSQLIGYLKTSKNKHVCIEMVACYGMPVGAEVFDTCRWIGRFEEKCNDFHVKPILIYRKQEKMNLCHTMRANDATITQALVDRFAFGQPNHGKGTKSKPGWFYGFKKDIWQAYAVGVTCSDLEADSE